MKSNIFAPNKINVGYQKRSGTYTGKLAYVIYFDEKGKLRKETSWNGWRDKEIENEIYDNEPTSGFVLNKKAGGYDTGWNHRQTYVRVYDPRGFEFEISVPNLLYILENTSSIKGKGLEGEFIYGWDGTELLLIPVDAPDYEEIQKYNAIVHANEFIKAKELKIGATYLTKDNRKWIFLGKYDKYSNYRSGIKKEKGKHFYFYDRESRYYPFVIMKAVTRKLISVVSDECVEDYAGIIDELEHDSSYSPIDHDRDEYVYYTYEEFKDIFSDSVWRYCYNDNKEKIECFYRVGESPYYFDRSQSFGYVTQSSKREFEDLMDLFTAVKPMWKRVYLANGKLYSEGK